MRQLRIAISGPTGSGKSTLARLLTCSPGFALVEEPSPTPLLREFSQNPNASCFPLQREIISERIKNETRIAGSNILILDRTVLEDLSVFVNLYHQRGLLSDSERRDLILMGEDLSGQTAKPDAFIFLSADVNTLRRRIVSAGAPVVVVQLLDRQISLYEQWMQSLSTVHLKIDTTLTTISELTAIAAWIQLTLSQALAGGKMTNLKFGLSWNKGMVL